VIAAIVALTTTASTSRAEAPSPSSASGSASAAAPNRPNILLIVADDLGWADVGWHQGFGKTPVMDRLAAEGVELDRHYVQPVCTPTRTALMSGRYPGRFGPQALKPNNLRAMAPGTLTIAAALQSLGYETSQCGKWHLGSKPEWGPNAFGFDHSYGTLTGAADPWTHFYRPGKFLDTWHRDGTLFQEKGNATELMAAEAVSRIRNGRVDPEGRRVPWFVYVPFHAVHTPVDAPDEYKRLYGGVVFDTDPEKQTSRLRLAAMVSQLDAKIGDLVAALEATGQRKNTLIVFTSDNGGKEHADNPYVGEVPGSPLNSENAPLRGEKNQLYEGGIRVCAFANWPGELPAGKSQAVMHAVDWFPTLAGLVGFEAPATARLDGVDRWTALSGRASPGRPRPIYVAHMTGAAIIDDDWKLIARKGGKQPELSTPELFNLAADPFETLNLAADRPDQVGRLGQLLAAEKLLDLAKIPTDLAIDPEAGSH
jgi:arylsulfatase A-like enzyme